MTEQSESCIPTSTVLAHTLWTKKRKALFLWTTSIPGRGPGLWANCRAPQEGTPRPRRATRV
ncbi:hypothetical protein GCM10018779_26280 [Streptomyces griseocarneus]|nr:hypothetical protein GCM10018779_26280 [Streptomyces griseocarneus]